MNDKIRESLDRSMADFSWKEKHRSNVMNRVRNASRPVRPLKAALAIGFALLMVLCIATAMAGAFSESFNGWLYEYWPDLATALMPVNLTYEDQGIRMEVLSAADKGEHTLIVYSMQDLEGDRLNNVNPWMNLDTSEESSLTYNTSIISDYDPETRKATYAYRMNYDGEHLPETGSVTFSVDEVTPNETVTVDLLPLFTQYRNQLQTAAVPENVHKMGAFQSAEMPESLRIIDCSHSLDIPLSDSVYLSGIGIIDGRLHVQLHFTDRQFVRSEDGSFSVTPFHAWVYLNDADGNSLYSDSMEAGSNSLSVLQWGGDEYDPELGFGTPEWEEFFFSVDPEAVEHASVFTVLIQKNLTPITGNWKVDIPLRLIRK